MDKAQIAKELTLALVDKISPTTRSEISDRNESLAKEVAKVYQIIYESLNELERKHAIGPVKIS